MVNDVSEFAAHPNILTIKQLANRYPAFTEGSLRWLIFNSKNRKSTKKTIKGNGFDSVLIRIGKRVLIDEKKFLMWVDAHGNHDSYHDA